MCSLLSNCTCASVRTFGLEELRARPEDDILVPVRAEKRPDQGPAVAHLYLHALVEPLLEPLAASLHRSRERKE